MTRVALHILGLLLATFLVVMLLVPDWRVAVIGRVRGEPFYHGKPKSFWVNQLKERDAGLRKEAIGSLTSLLKQEKIGPLIAPDVVPKLIEVFRTDEDSDTRVAAVAALSHCMAYRDDLVPIFAEAFRDPNRRVRIQGVRALGDAAIQDAELIAALVERLEEDDELGEARVVTRALVKLAPASIPPLIEALGDENPVRRRFAANALGMIGPPAIPQLKQALGDDNRDRKMAAKAILEAIQ